MPALPLDIDANLLWHLWQASVALATAALSIALILVLRRFQQEARLGRRRIRRKQLEAVIWGVLHNPTEAQLKRAPTLKRSDGPILCDLALDLLRPMRGEDADIIVRLLESWGARWAIKSILSHGNRGQRIRMLTLLAHYNDLETLTWLKRWIKSSDLYIQLAALRSLAARSAIETLPDILKQLARAKSHNIAMLADVLERFGEPAVGVLMPLASDAAQLDVRLAAITALGAIGSLETVPALIALTTDTDGDIRAQAVNALGRIGDDRAAAAITGALKDPQDAVRLQAAHAAGKLQLKDATPSLIDLLADGFWWVRYRAAEALYRMGEAGPVLLRSASLEDGRTGQIASQVLAELESR